MKKLKIFSLFAAMLFATNMWAADPTGCVDAWQGHDGSIYIKGWSFDSENTNAALAIHVYMYKAGVADPVWSEGNTVANSSRPDVNNVHHCGNNHGFERYISTANLSPGTYWINIWALHAAGTSGDNVRLQQAGTSDQYDFTITVKSPLTISYDANGGSNAPSSQQKCYGININLQGKGSLARSGYTTDGWATSATGNKAYNFGASYSGNASTKLFAHWTANTYKVKFNGNGSTGGSMSDQNFTYGTAQNLTANAFSKTGYTFAGWATSSTGAKAYNDKQSVNNLTATNGGTVNLYARWEIINYTVAYNLDGGEATNPTEYTVETETFTLNNPTKEGYTFTGWTGSNGETPQTEVTIAQGSTGNKSYTANWEEIVHTYTAVGNSLAIFGNLWDASITDNDLVLQEDGTYKWVKENVTFNTPTTIEYRVCEDHAWTVKYPSTEQPAYLDIPVLGDYKITIIYNPVGNEVSASAEKIGKPTIQLNGNFSGEWADTEAFEVVEEPYNNYAKLAMILEPGTYEFGVKVNGTWRANGYAYTRDSTTHVIEEGHTANLTIEADVKGYYSFYWFYESNRLSTYVPNVCSMYWKNVTEGNFEVTLGQESEVTLPKVFTTNMAFASNIFNGVDQVRLVSTDETVATIEYTVDMDGLGTITLHKAGECDIYAVHDITDYYCYDSVAFHLTVLPEPEPQPTPTVWTSLAVGDVIKVGDKIEVPAEGDGSWGINGNVLRNTWGPYELIRADIYQASEFDDPVVTETEDGAYYVFKAENSDFYPLSYLGKSGGLVVTGTSDGLVVTAAENKEFTVAVHDNGGTPTAVENVQTNEVQASKLMENGVLYIMYNGIMYNVQGARVR